MQLSVQQSAWLHMLARQSQRTWATLLWPLGCTQVGTVPTAAAQRCSATSTSSCVFCWLYHGWLHMLARQSQRAWAVAAHMGDVAVATGAHAGW
jgi:hypothetical protein